MEETERCIYCDHKFIVDELDRQIPPIAEHQERIEVYKAKERQRETQLKGKDKNGKPVIGGGKIATNEKKERW